MHIEFEKIEIFNFKSFDTEVFEFNKLKGMNLICGKNNDVPNSKNAAGKSTIFNALVFSLFGQTQENINNKNIANKFSKSKEVRVTTYFTIDENQYIVSSGFNKYGNAFCELKMKEKGQADELDITKSTIQETRKFLEQQILHCDLSIFLRTVILSADQNYNFFRLRKNDKKEFIEKMFDIQVFGKIYLAIHKETNNSLKDITSCQNKLVILNKNKDEYQNRIDIFEDKKAQEILTIDEKLKQLEVDYSNIKNKKITVNDAEVSKFEQLSDKIYTALEKIKNEISNLNDKNNKLKIKIHKLELSKEQKQKIIDKHSDLCEKLCNNCQEIFNDYYNLNVYKKEITELEKSIKNINSEYDKNNKALSDYVTKKNQYQNKLDIVINKIKNLTNESNLANKQLLILENNITTLKNQMQDSKKRENPYIDLLKENNINIESEMLELEKNSERYKYLKYAENVVSQDTLRKFIVKDLVGILNNKIKTYLTKLGAKYDVIFDSDMNYTFVSDYGAEYEYDNFSSGEKARLMISACFTFRDFMAIRNNLSSNILVIDEFIDSALDSMSIEAIINLMQEFSKTTNQNIFIISHRTEINNDVFDNIIQVEKTNNISKIKYLDA